MTEKNEYTEQARAQLDQLTRQLETFQAKAAEMQVDAQQQFRQQIEELRRQRDEAAQRLKALQEANLSAWDDMKTAYDRSWDEFTRAFESAMSRFRM